MSTDPGGAERLPPQSREAERCVLGSMLRDNGVIGDVLQIIRGENFYADAHQKIFQSIITLYDKGHPVDMVLLADLLKDQKYLEDVGGYPYLAELWDVAPTAANAEYYARTVRDKAIVRNLIHAGTEILRDSYDQSMPADELLEGAERKILDIAQMGITGHTTTLQEALHEAYERIDSRSQRDQMSVSGLPTGYIDLDDKTAGLQNSELIIIAARPSVGKCLAFDAEIVLADGSVATIEEIYQRRRGKLLTLQPDWRFGLTEPSDYVDDGRKAVSRVTTRLGRQVESTTSHPFLTIEGWRKLSKLKPGDVIAVPRRLDVFGTREIRECEIKILSYLIGDGNLTDTIPGFASADQRLRNDFTEAVTEFGAVKVREEPAAEGTQSTTLAVAADTGLVETHRQEFADRLRTAIAARGPSSRSVAVALGVKASLVGQWENGTSVPGRELFDKLCGLLATEPETLAPQGLAAISTSKKNPLTRWLEGLGLWGTADEAKFIPALLFTLTRPQVAFFLNRLFATDGWATVDPSGAPHLGYNTVSERLARQVQHLLLRFGIIASLRQTSIESRGSPREGWQVEVTEPQAIGTFIAEVGIFGKEVALLRVRRALEGRAPPADCDLIPVEVWKRLKEAKGNESWPALARRAGLGADATLHAGKRPPSRGQLAQLVAALEDEDLQRLADSDVYWDEIVSIEPVGVKQVYDLTIPDTHNFVANDVCVHNTAFALNVVRHITVEDNQPVFFVSLEQSRIELAERLLCCQARVDSHKLRKGHLSSDDMQKLIQAGETLRNARLFIDDTPGQGMLRIAANARRLRLRHKIALVVVDYLQLIDPDNRRDSRQEQVANISRRLKFLARELQIPVVALAQVNRSSEDRQDHKPRLADLRESGCLTGDSLVTLADSGARVPIRELVGRAGYQVWALDEVSLKLRPAEVSNTFATGRKPVFRLQTQRGRVIRATANHKFRTFQGWQRLDGLNVGDRIAMPRSVPCGTKATLSDAQAALLGHLLGDGCTLHRHALQYTTRELDLAEMVVGFAQQVFGDRLQPRIKPERTRYQVYLSATDHLTHNHRNPLADWLDQLGIFGIRAYEKVAPEAIFEQPSRTIALFLRHLWATDGCIKAPRGRTRHPSIYYASSSERLARDVQSLLLRLGINGVLVKSDQGEKGRPPFHVMVMGHDDILTFADRIGAAGAYKSEALAESRAWIAGRAANTNRDIVPREMWRQYAVPAMKRNGVTLRQMYHSLGTACCRTTVYKQNVSRQRLARVAQAVGGDDCLTVLATSDVYWDRIVSIQPDGEEEVFDLTVPGPSNFLCGDFLPHNSIEQDADTVMLLHRPEMYEPGQHEGTVEVIIGKQRNGPTGEITLTYLKQFMRFENFAIDQPFGYDS